MRTQWVLYIQDFKLPLLTGQKVGKAVNKFRKPLGKEIDP